MHLKYPRKKDFMTWEELGCFARALGFQKNLFFKNIPAEIEKEKLHGLDRKFISHLLDIKALHGDLHRTYNMHDAIYNCKVVEKALGMVLNRYLSFQELKEVRVAFQLYEHEDMLGLVVDQHLLMRTLKICGRVVSPLKLMQHIKHMKRHLPERLLLYEFMDLLLLCERESQVEVKVVTGPTGLDRHQLYKISNFESVLIPDDEKRIQQLNYLYEVGLNKVPTGNKQHTSWRDEQYYLLDSQPRIELVSRGQQRSAHLGDHLDHSEKKVRHARCGFLGETTGNPSFVDLNDVLRKTPGCDSAGREKFYRQAFDEDNAEIPRVDTRVTFAPPTAEEVARPVSRPNTSSSGSFCRRFRGTKREQLSRSSREDQIDILVSPRDLHNLHTMVENLHWDIETQGERLKQKFDKRMKEKYPRYFQLSKARETKLRTAEHQTKTVASRTEAKPLTVTEDQRVARMPRRRTVPKRDNIYKNLMARLNRDNTLLDFGGVEVPETRLTASNEHGRLLSWHEERPALQAKTSTVKNSQSDRGSSPSTKASTEEEKARHAQSHDKELGDLMNVFQQADFIASGRKPAHGTGHSKQNYVAVK